MKLEPQLIPTNKHRKEGRLPHAIKGLSWIEVFALLSMAFPFLVIGISLLMELI